MIKSSHFQFTHRQYLNNLKHFCWQIKQTLFILVSPKLYFLLLRFSCKNFLCISSLEWTTLKIRRKSQGNQRKQYKLQNKKVKCSVYTWTVQNSLKATLLADWSDFCPTQIIFPPFLIQLLDFFSVSPHWKKWTLKNKGKLKLTK